METATALEFRNEASISSVSFRGFGEVIDQSRNIIKVIGVGGGGSNAVKNMVNEGLTNVSFALVNTDSQALKNATVATKIQIGDKGLGVGGVPEIGREAAEFSIEEIKSLFEDNTKMVFITAGMGGGTGTGASPVIARVAREKGILTVGVVTLPFKFEKQQRIDKALRGVTALKEEVDSLIVINNERLIEICDNDDTSIEEALKISDKVVTTATRSIAEIITKEGLINRDFRDVCTVLEDGGSAVMSSGTANGENRLINAMCEALNSPMLNKADIENSHKLLYIVYQSHDRPVRMTELNETNAFMERMAPDLEVLWGLYYDDSLGDHVRVDIIATGFDRVRSRDSKKAEDARRIEMLREHYYNQDAPSVTTATDIMESLKAKYYSTPATTDAIPTDEETVSFNDNEETAPVKVNTDETSDVIIYFDESEEKVTDTPATVTVSTSKSATLQPVQTAIDFGNDESSMDFTMENDTEKAENENALELSDDNTANRLSYYTSKFMSFFDKLVTE